MYFQRDCYYRSEFCASKWVGLDNKNSFERAYYQKDSYVVELMAFFRRACFFLGGGVGLSSEFYGIL